MTTPQFLKTKGGNIAYVKHEGKKPGVVFIHGFRSDMTGEKAVAIEKHCIEQGRQFIRFDCFGHGKSDNKFEDGTIGEWKQNLLDVLNKLTDGPQVLIGSSMGGWLALLAARDQPKKVCAIIGIAAAPDFTVRLMWEKLSNEQKEEVQEKGVVWVPSEYYGDSYPITANFLEDSADHLLLDGTIDVNCPVHLIHGLEDKDVPWEMSFSINEKLASSDVKCTLIENGDHRLSTPENIAAITRILDKMLKRFD